MLKVATKFAPEPVLFEQAYRAGFHHAELYTNEAILAGWEEVADRARYYPLEYVLHAPNKKDISADTLQRLVTLYRALGCQALVIHQPQFDRYGAELQRLAPELRPAIENHLLTPEQFDEWAERNPGLTLDVEHLWKFTLKNAPQGELENAARRFLERHGGKLRHVHMPGYLPGHLEHRPMYCSRDMIFRMLTLFAEFRYAGFIVSEVDQEFQNPDDLHMDVLLFQRWRAQHESNA